MSKLKMAVILYLVFCSFLSVSSSIEGDGILDAKFFFRKMVFAYQQENDQFDLVYLGSDQFTGLSKLEKKMVDFAVALGQPRLLSPNTTAFPLVAQPYAFFYNVPELQDYNTSFTLNLTGEMALKIFTGEIQYWNDSALFLYNPYLKDINLDKKIHIVMRSGKSALLTMFNTYISSFSTNYSSKYSTTSSYPVEYADLLNVTFTGDNFSLFSPLYSTPYTITFAADPIYNQFDIGDRVKCANVIVDGNSLSPNKDTVRAAIDAASINLDTATVTFVKNTSGAWPITGFFYIFLYDDTTSVINCTTRTELLQFFRWFILSATAYQPIVSDGYITIFGTVREQVLRYLMSLSCQGVPSLEYTFHDPVSHRVSLTVIIISLVVLILIIVGSITLIILYETTLVGKIYHLLLMVASVFLFISILLHNLYPLTAALCQARTFTLFLGISILFGVVFCRNLQLKQIFKNVQKGSLKKKINNLSILIIGMVVVVLLELMFLTAWTVSDPLLPSYTTEINLWQLNLQSLCVSKSYSFWYLIQFSYLLILQLFGIFVVYRSWNMRRQVDDARMIAMSIYIVLVINIVSFILFSGSYEDTTYYYWAITYSLATELSFSLSIFIPKFVRLAKASEKRRKGSNDQTPGESKTPT